MTPIPLAEQIAFLKREIDRREIVFAALSLQGGRPDREAVDLAVARAALATLEAAEWRPIGKSTPREPVELYFPPFPEDRYGHGALAAMMLIDRVSAFPIREPTHWRPLPPPPESIT